MQKVCSSMCCTLSAFMGFMVSYTFSMSFGMNFMDLSLRICYWYLPMHTQKESAFPKRRYTLPSQYIFLCPFHSLACDCNTNRLKIETNCCHCHSLMGCGCFRQQYEVQGRIIRTLFYVSDGKGAASVSD